MQSCLQSTPSGSLRADRALLQGRLTFRVELDQYQCTNIGLLNNGKSELFPAYYEDYETVVYIPEKSTY